jgi:outer membrane immunogenic protein
MKKALLASVATSAVMMAHSGYAADLPLKAAAAPIPVPVYSWTGCYVGAQVGWGFARNKINQTQFNTFSTAGTLVTLSSASTGNVDSSGAVFGGQVGCDYQFAGGWVLGAQGMFMGTDLNRTDQDPHNGVRQVTTNALFPPDTFGGGSIETRTKWLASVTGRLGYAGWLPQTLMYVKGGGAWTENQIDLRNGAIRQFNLINNALIFDTSYSGWTIGGGFEWRLATNWSAFAEYNFYDFKNKSILAQVLGPPNVRGQTLSSDLEIHTVTVGVNYRFNWGG